MGLRGCSFSISELDSESALELGNMNSCTYRKSHYQVTEIKASDGERNKMRGNGEISSMNLNFELSLPHLV